MNKIRTIAAALLVSLALGGCGAGQEADSTGGQKPTLAATAEVSGNQIAVHVDTNLKLSPAHVGTNRKAGEGHIHISLDGGEKIIVSQPDYKFTELTTGKHNIKISLHNNDHTPYDVAQSIDVEVK